jgi:hypothetical protein
MTDYITIKLPVVDGVPAYGDNEDEQTERVCPLCGKGVKYGAPFGEPGDVDADRVVLSNRYGTVHADCYLSRVNEMETGDAWLTIATEIAKRPRAFSAAEVRAALTAVVRIAREEKA